MEICRTGMMNGKFMSSFTATLQRWAQWYVVLVKDFKQKNVLTYYIKHNLLFAICVLRFSMYEDTNTWK